MAAFILGLLLGGLTRIFAMSICMIARDEDDREEKIRKDME